MEGFFNWDLMGKSETIGDIGNQYVYFVETFSALTDTLVKRGLAMKRNNIEQFLFILVDSVSYNSHYIVSE